MTLERSGTRLALNIIQGDEEDGMVDTDNDPLKWRISSKSGGSNCVEVALLPSRVFVRDSKNRSAVILEVSPPVWRAFIVQICMDERQCRPVA